MSDSHSNSHILQALGVNVLISVSKGIAAYFTGSGAMLAETIHSASDCANQILLLLGVSLAKKPPTAKHPLGQGRELYFWSFMVALLLFTGGGVFSIYEGIHKLEHPEPVEWVWVGLVILILSLVLEGYSTISNIKELNSRRGSGPFFRFLQQTKDSDLVVVFGENLAASLGLMAAIPALLLAWYTGDPKWDALGSLVIGIILIGVALFLSIEVRSLLVGEGADPRVEDAVRETIPEFPRITQLLHLITIQEGPGKVLVLMKLAFQPESAVTDVSATINDFETALRKRCPEIIWSFIEPDMPRQLPAD